MLGHFFSLRFFVSSFGYMISLSLTYKYDGYNQQKTNICQDRLAM